MCCFMFGSWPTNSPIISGRYGISRTSGMCAVAEVSRMAMSIWLWTMSRMVAMKTPALWAIAWPGSR